MSESDTETSRETSGRAEGEESAGTEKRQPRKQASDGPRRSSGSAKPASGSRSTGSRQTRPRRETDDGESQGRSSDGESQARDGDGERQRRDDDGGGRTSSAGSRANQGERPRRRPQADDAEGQDDGESRRRRDEDDDGDDGGERSRRPRLGAGRAARLAVQQLAELTSRSIEGVVGVRRDGDSWIVLVEVVEDPRVPSTSDIMAEFEIELDSDGELMGYRRRARYARGHTEEG